MLPAELMDLNVNHFKQLNSIIKNKYFFNALINNVASTFFLITSKLLSTNYFSNVNFYLVKPCTATLLKKTWNFPGGGCCPPGPPAKGPQGPRKKATKIVFKNKNQ